MIIKKITHPLVHFTISALLIGDPTLVAKRLISYYNDCDFIKCNNYYKIISINVIFIFKYLYKFETKIMLNDHNLFIPFF